MKIGLQKTNLLLNGEDQMKLIVWNWNKRNRIKNTEYQEIY